MQIGAKKTDTLGKRYGARVLSGCVAAAALSELDGRTIIDLTLVELAEGYHDEALQV
jgi:hypothetical protein